MNTYRPHAARRLSASSLPPRRKSPTGYVRYLLLRVSYRLCTDNMVFFPSYRKRRSEHAIHCFQREGSTRQKLCGERHTHRKKAIVDRETTRSDSFPLVVTLRSLSAPHAFRAQHERMNGSCRSTTFGFRQLQTSLP